MSVRAESLPLSTRLAGGEGRRWRAVAWIIIYLGFVALPLLVLLRGPVPKGGGYWWDFAMALGFGGLAIFTLQSAVTARFRRATAPFGVDILYYFHRWAAVAGLGLVLAHYLILRLRYAEAIGPANPLVAAWPMTAGRLALLLFVVLIASSIWRKAFRIEYDRWRIGHAVLAASAVLLAVAHVWGVGHYTSAVGRGAVWMGYTLLWVLLIGYVRVVRPASLRRKPYRVTSVVSERGRAWTVTVVPEGHAGLRFSPGQFAWLTLGRSPFRAQEHPFSLSSSANERARLQFTIKELGDFTRTIARVRVGTVAYVDGPHGVFTTDHFPRAAGFVFLAGGIGIAPIMSMLRTLSARGERRPLRLVYGSRSWESVTFREELDDLSSRLPLQILHVLQEPPADWIGLQGVLDESVVRAAVHDVVPGKQFFVCGPKAMIQSVQRTLQKLGVPLHRVHHELFDMA